MISKCANGECERAFHYLRGGRLYRFDLRRPQEPCADVPNAICALRPQHASVYFWLCRDCSRHYSLQFSSREGVKVVMTDPLLARSGTVVARVQETE